MAIEDGVTLSTLLSSDIQARDIPGRLELYKEIRRPRVSRVRETSSVIAQGLETQEVIRDYMMFLSSHDAIEHAKEALSRYVKTGSGKAAPEA